MLYLMRGDSQKFEYYEDAYVEDYAQVQYIAVVISTGQIIQNGGELAQEVEVQKINKGNKGLEGKKIYLSSTDGFA